MLFGNAALKAGALMIYFGGGTTPSSILEFSPDITTGFEAVAISNGGRSANSSCMVVDEGLRSGRP